MCDPLHVIVPVAVIPGCKSCGRLQRVLDLRHPSAIMSFDAVDFVVWYHQCTGVACAVLLQPIHAPSSRALIFYLPVVTAKAY